MSKKIFYRYNPATDHYVRVYPSKRERVWSFIRNFMGAALGCAVLFAVVYLIVDTPREKALREDNMQLRAEIDIINRRLDASVAVMNDIMARDDNFYRVIMGAPRISNAEKYAGLNNENRYKHLNSLHDADLIKNLSRKIDLLDHQLYTQSKSFDELQRLAVNNQDRISHIPAIQPISEKSMKQMASGYGYRRDPIYGTSRFHEGLDFACDIGTSVYATADGRVMSAGWESGYGNLIEIDHGYGYVTRYAHLSKYDVKPGQMVKRGDLIAETGNTGKSTGPHLHYEVRFHGAPQNPINYYFMDITPDEYNEMIKAAENAGHVMD
jgi:murein DD-endopeptidase MepM/ murein hydrolase activator NlpD